MSCDTKSIYDALELLNKAAKDEKNEIQKIINDKFYNLKDVFEEKSSHVKEKMEESKEVIINFWGDIDGQIKKNPWAYIGGIALTAFALGISLKNKCNK